MKTIEVVAAIIKKDNMVFATQRGYGELAGGWEFPGGKVEEGESLKKALEREIKEELDADIKVGDLLDVVEYNYPNFHLRMHCFMCELLSDDFILKEHKDAKWLTRETLDCVDWLPADITLIEKLKEIM